VPRNDLVFDQANCQALVDELQHPIRHGVNL
jgi:hypothetical protein